MSSLFLVVMSECTCKSFIKIPNYARKIKVLFSNTRHWKTCNTTTEMYLRTEIFPEFWNIFWWTIFYKKVAVYDFLWCINYLCRTDIDEARVISALRHKSKFNLELFWKKNQIFGFPCCSTREVLMITVGLILTKLGWFFFLGVRTDTVLESSHGNMSAHKKFNSKLKISG